MHLVGYLYDPVFNLRSLKSLLRALISEEHFAHQFTNVSTHIIFYNSKLIRRCLRSERTPYCRKRVSDLTACQSFMKSGAADLPEKLSSNASLVKITQLQSRSIYGGKGISSRAFQTSRPFWVKFGAGDFHVTPLSNCKFVKKKIDTLKEILH